ncbi:MAG: 3-phosphoshikimate 1-carboxyvinyltransferase [Chitinivibrionales bacterium]|nr:3-phosphoshikimate 1-carboxyvinyltransferase [Chitinivibrionales bacterium]MBD3396566.1 3-phosphoshikimate 1-carboxyvinyltransferase [Chitinivibrionales bacterium]
MQWKVTKSSLRGAISAPPSKSHTIRALVIASLARGTSLIRGPLTGEDGAAAVRAAKGLGALVESSDDLVRVTGISTANLPGTEWIDLANSGTGIRLFAGAAATRDTGRWFTGDESLKGRPMRPLLAALNDLGANFALQSPNRDVPFYVIGPLKGGNVTVSGMSSQFVSSLLLCCPLAHQDSTIRVDNLQEKPYARITLWWLDRQDIRYEASGDLATFSIPGGQQYRPFDQRIPGDFSSATFPAVAAAATRSSIAVENLDFSDPQGDKDLFDLLASLGISVERSQHGAVVSGNADVRGGVIDLNNMPDALPALSVLACTAHGTTSIVNVKQARIKETDRIRVMTHELSKMGAAIEERDDGVNVNPSRLHGARVNGHHDHRVVMGLALAGMIAEGETIVDTAEAAAVTYPSFVEDFRALGANIEVME